MIAQREAGRAAVDPGQADGSDATEGVGRGRAHPDGDRRARGAEGG